MKSLYILFINFLAMLLCSAPLFSQTGPGGVGSSSSNILWLDANSLGLNNNDPVSSWTDNSGNSNHAAQSTSSRQPTFKTSQINGFPAVDFDGSADYLKLTNHITTNAFSVFGVYSSDVSNFGSLYQLENHLHIHLSNNFRLYYTNPERNYNRTKSSGSFSVVSSRTVSDSTGGALELSNNASINSVTRTMLWGFDSSLIGARVHPINNTLGQFANGQVAELIMFNNHVNAAQRNIVTAYLAAKYNLTATKSIYAYKTTYNRGVIGIGRESDGSHTSATGTGRVTLSNASSLGNGEYLLIGHDNAGTATSTSVPSNVSKRWTQVWRADETGTVGTVTVRFDISGALMSPPTDPNKYVILAETADGDFSNGGTSIIATNPTTDLTSYVEFTGVDFPDGAYFTLAQAITEISSAQDGNWNQTTTWNCGCIPASNTNVTINHNVDIAANASAADVNLSGGSLEFTGSDTLFVYGDFDFSSTFTPGSGTVAAVADDFAQVFTNSLTSDTVRFNNLYVNSLERMLFDAGYWSVSNSLQVTSGGMNVGSVDQFIMLSDATKTSQILESMPDAFLDTDNNYNLQRFISPRNAEFSDFSSPLNDGTIADLDDDLILSGVGGNNGNAYYSDSTIFYSIWFWNADEQRHDTVKSVSTEMIQGVGYEVYLANDLSTFNGATVSYIGTPTSGSLDKAVDIYTGWNLVGNPYYAHINYDNLDHESDLSNTFYIYNTNSGSYSSFSRGNNVLIAPGQGFWVDKTSTGSGNPREFEFEESDKAISTSSTFIRKKANNPPSIFTLKDQANQFSHELKIKFDPFASNDIDQLDGRYLPSPFEEVPAIYSPIASGNKKLVYNYLQGSMATKTVPVAVYTYNEGVYEFKVENLDEINTYYQCVYLKDKEQEELIDLSLQKTYEFNSTKGEHQRFELIFSNSYEDCISPEQKAQTAASTKEGMELRPYYDQWYLDFNIGEELNPIDIRIYNEMGQLIQQPQIEQLSGVGSIPVRLENQPTGIYIIRVQSADDMITKTINR
jgi:hypothetical protein